MTIMDVQPASPAHIYSRTHSTTDMDTVWPNAYSSESLYSCAMSMSTYSEAPTVPASPVVMPVPVSHPAPLRNLRSKHWVKVQGLPFTTTIEDLTRFFGSFRVSTVDNIILVMSGGRATGRAFVEFVDAEEATRACEILNRRYLDSRWLELRTVACRDVLRHLREVACAQENGSTLPAGVDTQLRNPTAFLPLPRTGNCLKLVGLPFGCSNDDITSFLEPYHVRPGGIHFCTRKGRATGKCVVEMVDAIEVIKAVRTLHRQYLGDRYVEVYPARPCDLYCDAEELKTSLHLVMPSCYNPRMLHSHMAPYRVIEERTVIMGSYNTPELHVVLSFPDQDITRAAQQYLRESLPDVYSAEIITEGDRMHFMQVGPAGLVGHNYENAAAEETCSTTPSTDDNSEPIEKTDAPTDRFVHNPYSLDRFADSEEEMQRTWSGSDSSLTGKLEQPSRSQLLHSLIKSVASRA